MRVMLIVNPFATATSPAGRDALVNTLSSHFPVDVEHTTHRGHAGELGARAAAEGYDAVIVHGGDGSVNETVNGLLGAPSAPPRDRLPMLAVIPGGSANVFSRTLGIDRDPLRATRQVIELLDRGEHRRIGLGHSADRWFVFNAGMGMDAIIVHAMEDKRQAGKAATPARYLWTTVRSFFSNASDTKTFTVTTADDKPLENVRFAFVSNTSPWTYLGSREIRTNPTTGFDTRLGVFAATSTGVMANLPLATRLLTHRNPKARHLFRTDDVEWVEFSADEPLDVQMDGDYIGAHTAIRFDHRPDALDVVAPLPQNGTIDPK
ncbi:diacylglycerol kinase family lipid kinase [Gordonia desulfuricans]|uniref:Diacylglycerol kinase family lipid kinase n=2 Tax=Gordonia desulfuricans TaxID=89051 RepID=A0A7K3LMS7_9ACTN|nr:diacylglycerol kinase family lipid kinase [Gordonia desulfuricans]